MTAALQADMQMAAMKVQVYGSLSYRIITLVAGLPPRCILALFTLIRSWRARRSSAPLYFGVPKLPPPYDTFEWAVVSSFFLVHAVSRGSSNVTQWLSKQ
jgi:hypothetical protein